MQRSIAATCATMRQYLAIARDMRKPVSTAGLVGSAVSAVERTATILDAIEEMLKGELCTRGKTKVKDPEDLYQAQEVRHDGRLLMVSTSMGNLYYFDGKLWHRAETLEGGEEDLKARLETLETALATAPVDLARPGLERNP